MYLRTLLLYFECNTITVIEIRKVGTMYRKKTHKGLPYHAIVRSNTFNAIAIVKAVKMDANHVPIMAPAPLSTFLK